MNQLYSNSITHVQSLYEGFGDVIHDWSHSQRVAANAKLLAANLGYDDVDFLELCALWHDAARTQGITDGHEEAGALMAKQDVLNRGADDDTANKVYEAIRNHKSSSNPTTIEGKIIRDADKLDIFAVIRWQQCAEAGWTVEYAEDLRKTVEVMGKYPNAYTYELTQQLFEERVDEFMRFFESVKVTLPE